MNIDKACEDALRGQKFIGKTATDKKDEIERICRLCLYRYDADENPLEDCVIIPHKGKKTPRELFGIKKNEVLPRQLDGKEVGNYCPYFTPWYVE